MFARTIGRAVAVVAARGIEATALQTWRGCAVILGLLAECARVTERANAFEFAHQIVTFAAIATRRCGALIDVCLAVTSRVARRTGAAIVIDQINATGAILALTHTIVKVLGARGSTPTLQAEAGERARQIEAFACIDAGSSAGQVRRARCGHRTGQCRQQRCRATQIARYDGTGCGG